VSDLMDAGRERPPTAGMWPAAREPDRRRVRDAYAHRYTPEVPFYEPWVAPDIVDAVLGRKVGLASIDLACRDYVELCRRTGMDVAYLYEGWMPGRKTRTDPHGRAQYMNGLLKSRGDLGLLEPPNLERVRRRIEGMLKAREGTRLGLVYAVDTAPSVAFTAVGPADYYLSFMDDPDFLDEVYDRIEIYTIPLVEAVCEYPLDGIWISGLQCTNSRLSVSMEVHERMILPRLERVARVCASYAIPAVLHSDGDSTDLLPWITRTGFAALHPIEPGIGRFDIRQVKDRWGKRLCLHGNIDVGGVLSRGTPEEVWADVRAHLRDLAPGGGYVCGSSHDIAESIPADNFAALCHAVTSTRVNRDGTLQSS
jgi:uroporphyrinogen decarboxylase-like protein